MKDWQLRNVVHMALQQLNEGNLEVLNEWVPVEKIRSGGYFCITAFYPSSASPLVILPVGNFPEEKILRYHGLAQEKAKRLLRMAPEHLTSWQSRDEAKDQFAGAIWTSEYILSFSGFVPLNDEAFCLLIANNLGLLTQPVADLAKESGSWPIFEKLILRSSGKIRVFPMPKHTPVIIGEL